MAENVNELGNKKIFLLLIKYAIPSILGTMVIALYNIIDSVYIGYGPDLGDSAITGLGIVLPVMNLIAAIGMLVGAGASGRISIYLGGGDKKSAECILGTACVMSVVFTLFLTIILYLFLDSVLWGIGATEESFNYAKEFLKYYLPGNVFFTLNYVLTSIMRASGYPKKAMFAMGLGVIVNILLAPIFIFGLEWGMKGAAIATNLSIIIGLCFVLFHFINEKNTLVIRFKGFKFLLRYVWSILSIGLSPFSMQVMASIVTFFINNFLREYGGTTAIGAYALANRVIMIFILVIFGLTQGMQPIIGYNYGAKKYDRVGKTLKYSIGLGVVIGGLGVVAGIGMSKYIVKVFNPEADLEKETITALKIMSVTLPLSGVQMVISNYFQSIGQAGKSIFLSMTRQCLILIPALFILSFYYKLNGVWVSIPFSDIISTVLAISMLCLYLNRSKK